MIATLEQEVDQETPEELEVRRREELLKASLNDIGLSVRTVNALENDDETPNAYGVVRKVHTVGQLLQMRPEDIMAIPNMGEKTLQEIFTCLAKHGFARKGFVVRETEEDRAEQARRMRMEQLHRRIGYR